MKTFQLVLLFCLLSQYVIAVGNAEYLILPSEVHPSTSELFHLWSAAACFTVLKARQALRFMGNVTHLPWPQPLDAARHQLLHNHDKVLVVQELWFPEKGCCLLHVLKARQALCFMGDVIHSSLPQPPDATGRRLLHNQKCKEALEKQCLQKEEKKTFLSFTADMVCRNLKDGRALSYWSCHCCKVQWFCKTLCQYQVLVLHSWLPCSTAGSHAVRGNRKLQHHIVLPCPECSQEHHSLHQMQSEAFKGSVFHDLRYAFTGRNNSILGKSSVVLVTMRFRSGWYDCSLHAPMTDACSRR